MQLTKKVEETGGDKAKKLIGQIAAAGGTIQATTWNQFRAWKQALLPEGGHYVRGRHRGGSVLHQITIHNAQPGGKQLTVEFTSAN